MAIGQFANAGNLRPTKRELRMATGLSENAVDNAVRALRQSGWLLVMHETGGSNAYRMQRGPWDEPPPSPHAVGGEGPPSPWGPLKGREKGRGKEEKKAAADAHVPPREASAAPSMPAPKAEESAAASLAQEAPLEPAEAAEALEAITARFGASAGPVARSSLRQGRATQAEATLVLTTLVLRYADPSVVRNLGGLVTRLLQQARSGALEDAREKITAEKEKSARRLAAERAEAERIRQLEQQYVRGIDPEERSGVAQDIAGFLEQLRLKAGGGDLGAAS